MSRDITRKLNVGNTIGGTSTRSIESILRSFGYTFEQIEKMHKENRVFLKPRTTHNRVKNGYELFVVDRIEDPVTTEKFNRFKDIETE